MHAIGILDWIVSSRDTNSVWPKITSDLKYNERLKITVLWWL